MSMMSPLQQEWTLLQQQHEQYERGALLIKLAGVALFALGLAWRIGPHWLGLVALLLWGQEAMLKTYQARIAARLLRVEQGLLPAAAADRQALPAFQLHSEWAASRPGGLALLGGYARSACKPTVAFPHALLLLASLALILC
ncbi:hypothetical protein [Paucibacter sp. XJ19-41]|uniref:hypothetical protein n=1 Tax=Paucibacter sp. XJ19-41 TaxID=2927824 RepID=UPI00234B1567|nr:hypothetical protein [Paucibacter sp. XJ19-41]MDC6171146.1 hypothetical protein [Paucibacter sp. XJ19-41]